MRHPDRFQVLVALDQLVNTFFWGLCRRDDLESVAQSLCVWQTKVDAQRDQRALFLAGRSLQGSL